MDSSQASVGSWPAASVVKAASRVCRWSTPSLSGGTRITSSGRRRTRLKPMANSSNSQGSTVLVVSRCVDGPVTISSLTAIFPSAFRLVDAKRIDIAIGCRVGRGGAGIYS